MTQTERTTPEVNSILQDNASSDISPEDVRDAIASAMGGYAGLLLTVAGAPQTLVSVAQTPVKIDQYDVVSAQSVDNNIDGSLADDGTGILTVGQAGIYFVSVFASFSLSQNNRLVTFQTFRNGAPGLVEVERFVSNGSDVGEIAASGIVPLGDGDEIDFRVSQSSGSADITFVSLGLNMHRVG